MAIMIRRIRFPPARELARRVASVLLVVVVAVLQWVTPVGGSGAPADGLVVVALPLLLVQAVPLLLRHRFPLAVLAAATAGFVLACLVLPVAVPFCGLLALFTIVVQIRSATRAGVAAGAAAATTGAVLLTVADSDQTLADMSNIPGFAVFTVFTACLLRARHRREEALAEARVAATRRSFAEQRLAIARDMHDLVGHGLSTVAVQSSTVRLALQAGDTAAAQAAITAVEAGSRETMRGMRELLTVLRNEEGQPPQLRGPLPDLSDVARLVEETRRTGTAVALELDEDLALAPAVALCTYRIVQESLTNAAKHAPGATVSVRVVRIAEQLTVEVRDHGPRIRRARGGTGGGLGVRGMQERVAALGGRVTAVRHGNGWLVHATLPLIQGVAQ